MAQKKPGGEPGWKRLIVRETRRTWVVANRLAGRLATNRVRSCAIKNARQ